MYNIIWESLYIDKAKFKEYYLNFAAHYTTRIKDAIREGSMKDDLDPEVVAWSLMGLSNFLGLRYAMFSEEENLDEVARKAMEMIEKGLFA